MFDADKIYGMFWGLCIGDALGAPFEYSDVVDVKKKWTGLISNNIEFLNNSSSNTRMSFGQVTDDTELTLSLLNSLLTFNKLASEKDIKSSVIKSPVTCKKIGYPLMYDSFYTINNYIDWYNSNPNEISSHCEYLFSVSNETLFTKCSESHQGLVQRWNKYKLRYDNYYQDDMNNWSKDNSCIMRATPLVFCSINDVLLDCKLTHLHPVCQDAVSVYTQILKNCLTTKIQNDYDKNLSTALISETNQVKFKDTDIFASTKECKSLIEQVLKRKDRFLDVNKSDVLTTLYCGLNCYAFFDKFETAMEWLFSYHLDNNFGIGDADSNAAICGAIMGAKIGLRAMLQEYKTNFNYNIVSKIKTNRPYEYQPSMRLNYFIQELIKLL